MWSDSATIDPNSPRARIRTTTIIATTIALTFLLSLAVTLGGLDREGYVLGNDRVREGDLGGGIVSAADGGGVSSSSALGVGVGVDVSMEAAEAKEN